MNYGMRFMTLYRRQGSRPSPWKRNAKKAKWLSGEALQIAVKRREAKSKGEKERYKHLNAEFQRIARRDKKDFLSDQCREIEGKTGDLFKKIRDTKGTFHAKMVSPLLFASLLFTAICKASSDSHFAFFAFLFHGDGLDPCLLYNVMNLQP